MRLPPGASFALRSLRRAPGCSAAILTVALGIGAIPNPINGPGPA